MSEAVTIEPAASRSGGGWRRVFIGPYGLRAGWSLLIYVFITQALGAALFFAIQRIWHLPDQPAFTPGLLIAAELTQAVIVLGVTALMGRIEKRSLATYGIPLRQAFGFRFWEGALWGVGSCGLVYALMAAFGGYRVQGLALQGVDALRWPLLWALAMLCVGLYEEPAFRGFQLFTLSRGITYWPAALLLSLGFGALHYFQKPNESWLDFLNVGLIGLFFCFTVRRTGDIWFATGWHFTFNFVSMGVMGSPNTGNEGGKPLPGHFLASSFSGPDWLTGGPTGAQASVFTLAMAVALFALFHLRYREARYPVLTETRR
ncbi:MAG TPA: type II CAAX endopeptidase family protein [Thermoanaerobaculia bacterium]|nr:type II CAAX endopeptidase family protein [Thermoanaerobaculia bacterium]